MRAMTLPAPASPAFAWRPIRAGFVRAPVAHAVAIFALAAGMEAGFMATSTGDTAQAVSQSGMDLTHLLRAMALIKSVMAVAAAGAVLWRLALPVTPARLAIYALACAAMAGGPGLIWDMAHVGAGALLLHAGLLATILLLWRDPAVSRRLAELVAARRARAA